VEGDIRDQSSQAYADYTAYWETHKALLSPGGVDIFTENSAFGPYDGSPVQWEPETGLTFWSSDMDELPIGVYWQVRSWLEEFTRNEYNPWDGKNTSALWSVVSLTMDPAQQPDGTSLLYLYAAADNDPSLYFGARLYFDPSAEDGQYIRPDTFAMGSWDEVIPVVSADEMFWPQKP
jgi:hypothetical protein